MKITANSCTATIKAKNSEYESLLNAMKTLLSQAMIDSGANRPEPKPGQALVTLGHFLDHFGKVRETKWYGNLTESQAMAYETAFRLLNASRS